MARIRLRRRNISISSPQIVSNFLPLIIYTLLLQCGNCSAHNNSTSSEAIDILPTISSIKCPSPPVVPNSRVHYPDRNVGSVAVYTCYAAYNPIGLSISVSPVDTNITCLPTGRWSEADFACIPKRSADEFYFGAMQELDDNQLAVPPGGPDIPADALGMPIALLFGEERSPQNLPSLSGKFCESLPRISHGSIVEEGSTSFSTAIGSRLSFMCSKGHYLIGPPFIECLPSLNWTEVPACRPYCQNPPIVPDSVQKVSLHPDRPGSGKYFEANMTVEYVCNSGYSLVSPRNGASLAANNDTKERGVTCLETGQWTDPPMCMRIEMEQMNDHMPNATSSNSVIMESCGAPPPTRHGNVSLENNKTSSEYGIGEKARYTCFSGFRLVGPDVIECKENAKWSMNPTCVSTSIPDTCPPPPEVSDSVHAKANPDTGWIVGETVLYLCLRGFYRIGDPVVQCLPRGYWTTPPSCIPQNDAGSQPSQKQIVKAVVEAAEGLPGNMAMAEGYNGPMLGVNPANFNKFDCQPPPNIEHGYIIQVTPTEGRYPRGTVVTYRCAPSYTLYGESSIMCSDILLWETPPQCRSSMETTPTNTLSYGLVSECPPDPTLPPNTQITERYMPTGRATIGSFIVLDCKPDHYMVDGAGSPILWCDSNFHWQQQEPPIQCRPKSLTTSTRSPATTTSTRYSWPWESNSFITGWPGHNRSPPPYNYVTDSNGNPYWPDLDQTTTHQAPTGTTEVPSCTPPPEIPNGFMVKITRPNYNNAREMNRKNILYYYGVTVTYVCMTGFNFIGASTIMCQLSGEWSGIPVCSPLATLSTPAPPTWFTQPPVTIWQTTPGNIFPYGPGQSTTTLPYRTTEMIPRPTPQSNCDMPPTIDNGVVIGRSPTLGPMIPGSSVEYTCMGDFQVFGNAVIHCLPNGMWEMPPVCVPPPPTQSTPSTTRTTTLMTTPSTTTSSTTVTTTTTTTPETTTTQPLRPTQQQCRTPPTIPNGELIYILPLEYAAEKTYYIGTAATYGCTVGFRMIGTPTAYCGNDLTWHGVPVCASEPTTTPMARCPRPPEVPNGFVITNSAPADGAFNPGSSVQYQCNASYRMIGFPRIFCTFELKWEGAPICEFVPPNTTTTAVSTTTTATTTTTTTQPTTITTMSTTTRFVPPPATIATQPPMQPVPGTQTCPSPPLVSFATLIAAPSPPYTMGTIARYQCAPGFALMGPDSVVCLPFSQWSKQPECVAFSTAPTTTPPPFVMQQECPPPPVIPYGTSSVGSLANTKYSPGSAIVYSCQNGYALIGTPIILCAVNGEWSTTPACVAQNSAMPVGRAGLDAPKRICPEPPAVLHGYRSSQTILDASVGWQTGDSFEVDCFPPYVRLGRAKAVCSEAGTWSSTPNCVRPNTNNPYGASHRPKSANSVMAQHRYRQKYIEMQQPGVAAAKACSQPPTVDHAVAVLRSGSGHSPGTAYLYICEPPFKIRGSPTVICSATGLWSTVPVCEMPTQNESLDDENTADEGQLPTAQLMKEAQAEETSTPAVYCGPPPSIDNGKVMSVPAVSTVGSVVTYECHPHHQMRGPYTISCMPSGRWSKTPECISFLGIQSQRNNRAYPSPGLQNVAPPMPVRAQQQVPARGNPMLFASRFDTPSALLYSAFSSQCYGGPEWPSKIQPGQLSTKLATRELHIFREITFNCTGLIVEWRYISVLPIKSQPVIVHFGIWRLVNPRSLKYRLVDSTKVTIVGSVRPEETISLKLHEAEYLHVEPGDVFGLHYDDGASSQQPGAIPLAYTFSPSPFTQPQLSSTLASLDDHQSLLRKHHHKHEQGGEIQVEGASDISGRGKNVVIDFDNYGFRFFRLPFVRGIVEPI